MGTGVAEDQYRRECARKGGTVISWMEDRTESWTPNDDKEYSIKPVQVSPAEVVYYFLSVLMDADGKQPEGKPFKASSAKLVSDTLVQVFVEVDFEEVSTRVMSNVDEIDNWIWKMYRAKYNFGVEEPTGHARCGHTALLGGCAQGAGHDPGGFQSEPGDHHA